MSTHVSEKSHALKSVQLRKKRLSVEMYYAVFFITHYILLRLSSCLDRSSMRRIIVFEKVLSKKYIDSPCGRGLVVLFSTVII